MDDEQHERVGRLAHELWEKDGRPEGKDAEHWQAARRLIEARDADGMSGVAEATAPDDARSTERDPEPEVSASAAALD